ncbi:hypothetical protein ACI2KS_13860 [Pseudomonas sp. NPDC087358]|uniref:hypothetical protein n=1 Tax=Pseudomonas sp. NPDC087358 TaxID=3364439 RepID=UPI00384B7603
MGKELKFENVSVNEFLASLGIPGHVERRDHFQSVMIDQREGLLCGQDNNRTSIIGRPLMTMEAYVIKPRSVLN